MPLIKDRLISYIIDNRGGQATVPVFGGRPEPLLAVYSRAALRTMEAMLVQGERSLTGLIERLEVNYLDEPAIRKIDPEGESFMNINTVEDYNRAIGKRALI
jgi:molybdopterin-guanine dinucleotide biosynthesis protein A